MKVGNTNLQSTRSTDCQHYRADLAVSGREAILQGLLRPCRGLYANAIKQWRLMKEGLLRRKESGCCADPLDATRAASSQRPLCPRLYSGGRSASRQSFIFLLLLLFFLQSKAQAYFLSFFLFGILSFQPCLSTSARTHTLTDTHTCAHARLQHCTH